MKRVVMFVVITLLVSLPGSVFAMQFSEPVILVEISNASNAELPINQWAVRLTDGISYHDFGSDYDNLIRVYSNNGLTKIGSPSKEANTVAIDMSAIQHLYEIKGDNGMRFYILIGSRPVDQKTGTVAIEVIGKDKSGQFVKYAGVETWKKFYPQDQEALKAFYADRQKNSPASQITYPAPQSPIIRGHYSVMVIDGSIGITGWIKSLYGKTHAVSQWVYYLNWEEKTQKFNITYQQLF